MGKERIQVRAVNMANKVSSEVDEEKYEEEKESLAELGSISSGTIEAPYDDHQEVVVESNDIQVRDRMGKSAADKAQYQPNVEQRLVTAEASFVNKEDEKRSKDVVPLTAKFEKFKDRLKLIQTLLNNYLTAYHDLEMARFQMYHDVAIISCDSPLYNEVGKMLDADTIESVTTKEAIKIAKESGTHSLMCVTQLSGLYGKVMELELKQKLFDYTKEWETIVTKKVDLSLAELKKLDGNQIHYQKKVKKLRDNVTKVEAKGGRKRTIAKRKKKMKRNEGKLLNSEQNYETKAGQVCHLIEQIVDEGWRDLVPLVENALQWELRRYENDKATFGTFFPPLFQTMKNNVQKTKAEDAEGDLEAALTLQRDRNMLLRHKLDRLEVALKGDWKTKNELFKAISDLL